MTLRAISVVPVRPLGPGRCRRGGSASHARFLGRFAPSAEFGGGFDGVVQPASTIAQYSLMTRLFSNCEESRRAAFGVFAQSRTPEVGRSNRWTIPR